MADQARAVELEGPAPSRANRAAGPADCFRQRGGRWDTALPCPSAAFPVPFLLALPLHLQCHSPTFHCLSTGFRRRVDGVGVGGVGSSRARLAPCWWRVGGGWWAAGSDCRGLRRMGRVAAWPAHEHAVAAAHKPAHGKTIAASRALPTAFRGTKTPPLPCVSTPFAVTTLSSSCVSTAFVAKALPSFFFLAVPVPTLRQCVVPLLAARRLARDRRQQ